MAKIRGIKPEIWTDENFVELSPFARLLFIGLWNYACDNGHLEDKSKQIKMRILPTDDTNCAELLREIEALGMIERADGWVTIPNLTEHQYVDWRFFKKCDKEGCEFPPDVQKKHDERDSQRKTRRAHAVNTAGTLGEHAVTTERPLGDSDSDGDIEGDGDGDGDKKKSQPTVAPTPAQVPVRDDVTRICEHLKNRLIANGCKTPTITKAWEDAARLMLDRDNRTEEQIITAINWATADEFWRSNILSMPKLRAKYDQLRLAAQRKPGATGGTVNHHAHHLQAEALAFIQEQTGLRAIEGGAS